MRTIISITFILATCIGYCQSDSLEVFKKFSIGINYSIDQTFRVLKISDAVNSLAVKDSRDETEEPSINYTVGLSFNYYLNKKINIEITTLYAQTGYQRKESTLTFGNLQDPRRGFSVDFSNPPLTERLIVKQNYLSIPVKIRAFLIGSKLKLFLEGGFSTDIYLRRRLEYQWTLKNGEKKSISENGAGGNMNRINMAIVLGVGVEYALKNRCFLRLNPIYRRSINQISDWVNKEYRYSFGLNVGVFYMF